MKRITLPVAGAVLALSLSAARSAADTITWNLANPTNIVAYQIGNGVLTIATAAVLCQTDELVPASSKHFDYTFNTGTRKGILCLAGSYTAPVAAYYQIGSPATVTVHTKAGIKTATVTAPPPVNPAIGHLPFH